ncbi:UNVERIFIED_CONTAM: hypothetical protein FKN15_076880 [Acipenser sinensis]
MNVSAMQPPQSYSIVGQHSSGQLTGKSAGAHPVYRGRCPPGITRQQLLLFPGRWMPYIGYMMQRSFPPVETSIAALVQAPNLALLSKDTTCPNKQCQVSEVILKHAYSSS